MEVKIEKGQWFDEKGRLLTEEEKNRARSLVYQELDQDLSDQGFEGFIKRWLKKLLAKDGLLTPFIKGSYIISDQETEAVSSEDRQSQLDQEIEQVEDLLQSLKAERDRLTASKDA